jgi:16S rRNA (guanine527-N7)-methyltransferase
MKDKAEEVWARILEELGEIEPPGKLREYVEELVKWGGRIHLTGRERMTDAIAAQVSDSMIMLELAGGGGTVVDVGAGAGFPGMVWKLARPDWDIVLFERKERLATFLARTATLLGLEGVSVRAEDAALNGGCAGADVVTSKAAGRLGDILPIAGGMLKRGGIYVTAKGEGWEAELEGVHAPFSLVGRIPLRRGRGEAVSLALDR